MDETALRREIAILETELATLQTHEAEGRSAFSTLEQQLAKVSARIAEVRRAAAERDVRLERARLELAQARGGEAEYHEARRQVDAAAEELANRIEGVLSALTAYDDARGVLSAARDRLAPSVLKGLSQQDVPEEAADHDAVTEQWARLSSALGSGSNHEDDLIEAAVRSSMGHAIASLPAPLRDVARRRREDYLSNLARSLRADQARARQIES